MKRWCVESFRQAIQRNPYLVLILMTLAVRAATALPLQQAGYMDASYAIHVAENVARGRGFTEEILWNYLDAPAGLPHPSNLYWMPLPSILIAPFFVLLGVSYRAAQIPFVLISSLLPVVSFGLSRRVFGRDDYAWVAALFTIFTGFYMVYWVSPDNFAPFALTASLCLILIAKGIETKSAGYLFGAGVLAGLSHLARADGVLLLAVAPLALVGRSSTRHATVVVKMTAALVVGYLVVMSPWFLRNYLAVGTPYPSAGAKTLWLTNYDEMFRFADDLSLSRYLAWGIGPILGSKVYAAGMDLLVVALGALQVFLVPFAAIGLWQLRRRVEFLPFFIYAALLYGVMVLAFTFPSWRGTMLHSSTALIPFFAVAEPLGIDVAVRWVARRRRHWATGSAEVFFRWGFVALAAFISLFMYSQGIFGPFAGTTTDPLWNERDAELAPMAEWLDQHAQRSDMVMEVDPPAFYNISHRPTIAVPTDSVQAVLDAAQRYGARYLILRHDHPKSLNELYQRNATIKGLACVAQFTDGNGRPAFVYRLQP